MANNREREQPPDDTKRDCYSAGERKWMEWGRRARARLFGPVVRGMARSGVWPDHLTLAALLIGLAFCPLFFLSPAVALAALGLHVLLDGLDGPLARELGVDSPRGSFTDTAADQTVVAASMITLMWDRTADLLAGALYVLLYTVVVAFAMVRNALAVPYSWLFRPRFLVYAWLAVELWWWPGSLDGVLWLCNSLLAVKCVTGFVRIRGKM